MDKYVDWDSLRFVIHNTETDEIKETDCVRGLASIIAEWVSDFSRGEIWELVDFAMRHGVPVSMGCVVFVDTLA